MKEGLQVYNTLTRTKEAFVPLNPPMVGMYVCGPTVYSHVHLGNCRTFVSFDMIYRYLRHLGFKVRYVRNITDAGHLENDADAGEDKIGKKARLEQLEPMEIVQRYTVDFHRVMDQFNAFPPSIEPTATGHIVEQIALVQAILEKGFAYEVNGSVYFDVAKYNASEDYGKLSGRNIEEMLASAEREDESRALAGQGEKRNPIDFALWKKASPEHIMRWDSPWGEGFPGWHLECSVMSTKYLGSQFDIHGGGMDLKFPHHECEVAQCKAGNGEDPVKYWLHTNMLTFEGARMAKSTGNSILPGELFSGNHALLEQAYSPMTVRFFMMQAHYRNPLDFSNSALLAADKALQKLMAALDNAASLPTGNASTMDVAAWKVRCYEAMNDDFNTPVLIAQLFEAVKFINSVKDGKASVTTEDRDLLHTTLHALVTEVLGLRAEAADAATDEGLVNGLMDTILDMRQEAKANKDWGTADKIRDALTALNIRVKDSKEGATWTVED